MYESGQVMKHFGLKLNYAIEIGAHLAYLGHYQRTKDENVLKIADEEVTHRFTVQHILTELGERPSKVLNGIFTVIGHTVGVLCLISPKFALNFVARSLELFAVFSYSGLATLYPKFRRLLKEMAYAEERHRVYFTGGKTQ